MTGAHAARRQRPFGSLARGASHDAELPAPAAGGPELALDRGAVADCADRAHALAVDGGREDLRDRWARTRTLDRRRRGARRRVHGERAVGGSSSGRSAAAGGHGGARSRGSSSPRSLGRPGAWPWCLRHGA